jgi:hypothetical protein
MANSELSEWTPEQQKLIDYFGGLDRIGLSIAAYMQLALPMEAITKLLPLADIAIRDKDPAGALVFFETETPFPHVKYYPDAKSVLVALVGHGSNRFVLPLAPVIELSMGPTCSEKTQ